MGRGQARCVVSVYLNAVPSDRCANYTEIESPMPAHCECQLLAKIHNRPAIPYIGVSKLSCAFCDTYFAAYRDATRSKIRTRGANGKSADWSYPVLAEDPLVDAKIRKQVSSELLLKISDGWSQYRQAQGSVYERWFRLGDGEGTSVIFFPLTEAG